MLSEYIKPLKGLAPADDRFNGNPATDVFSMKDYERITFYVYHKGGTTGVVGLTIEECSDLTGAGANAIPFTSRRMTTGDSDTLATIGYATYAGLDTIAGQDTIIEIEVNARDLAIGKPCVRLQTTEKIDDPVSGAIFAFAHCARYKGLNMPSAIVS